MIYVAPSAAHSPLLSRIAVTAGQTVHACAGVDDALKLIRAPASHIAVVIVISDDEITGVSKEDGLEVIRAVRTLEHRQALPIVVLIAKNSPQLANEVLLDGATDVFHVGDHAGIAEALGKYVVRDRLPVLTGHVLLVEDSEVFANHVADLCRSIGLTVDICASADAGAELMQQRDYHLAIIDILLDGVHTGIVLARRIRGMESQKSATPILVMSGYRDTARRIEALRAGADEFIEKPIVDVEFIWRIQRLLGEITDPSLPQLVPTELVRAREEWQRQGLSQREMEICNALIDGHSDKQISADLGISFWTVRSHVGSVFTKLGLLNRRELLTRYLPTRAN